MLTIFQLTMREVLNKKIFLIAALLSLVFLALFGTMLSYTGKSIANLPIGNLQKAIFYPQLLSLGLYFASFLINFFAVFISVGSISTEVENGIMQAIVTKPVRRSGILFGKYAGYAATIIIFGAFIFVSLLTMSRLMCGFTPANALSGLLLFVLQPLILLTLAIWGSTFLSTMANGVLVIMLYMLATVGGMVENIGRMIKNTVLVNIGIVSSLLTPTDATYRKMVSVMISGGNNPLDALNFTPFGASTPPSTAMIFYTCLYIAALLFLAVRVFSKRDI